MIPSISFTGGLNLLGAQRSQKKQRLDLKFKEIHPSEYEKIIGTMHSWEKIALENKNKHTNYLNCLDICKQIRDHIANPIFRVYTVENENKEIQSIAITKNIGIYSSQEDPALKEYLEISFLVSNPQHMNRGAAQCLINQLALILLNDPKNNGIYVESLDIPIPFFEGLGFIPDAQLSSARTGPIPMIRMKEETEE